MGGDMCILRCVHVQRNGAGRGGIAPPHIDVDGGEAGEGSNDGGLVHDARPHRVQIGAYIRMRQRRPAEPHLNAAADQHKCDSINSPQGDMPSLAGQG